MIQSIAQLQDAKLQSKEELALRVGDTSESKVRHHVLICGGTGCTSSGSTKIREKLEAELAAKGISDEIKIVTTGCFGLCALGPIMIVYPEGTFYSMITS